MPITSMIKEHKSAVKDKVLAKWPMAHSKLFDTNRQRTWHILNGDVPSKFLGKGDTEYEAWKDAAQELRWRRKK